MGNSLNNYQKGKGWERDVLRGILYSSYNEWGSMTYRYGKSPYGYRYGEFVEGKNRMKIIWQEIVY